MSASPPSVPTVTGQAMNDKKVFEHINELVDEEHRLRNDMAAQEENAPRLKLVTEELGQCWDLLRQRRARREYGGDAADSDEPFMKPVDRPQD